MSCVPMSFISRICLLSFLISNISTNQETCPTEQLPKRTTAKVAPHSEHYSNSIEFLIKPRNTTGCLGMSVKIRVFYVANNSTQMFWYRDRVVGTSSTHRHQPITIDGNKFCMLPAEVKEENDYYFFICNLTMEDIGQYTVELRNNIGSISQTVFLSVSVCNNVTRPNNSTSQPLMIESESNHRNDIQPWMYVLMTLGVVLPLAVTVTICYCLRCRKLKSNKKQRHHKDVVHLNPIYNQIPAPDVAPLVLPLHDPCWEIDQNSLQLEYLLGEGAFGKVYQGIYLDNNYSSLVAIKMLKDNCSYKDRVDFVKEIEMMKVIGHHINIIGFYGYSVTEDGFIQVVVEFAKHGNLRHFLRHLGQKHDKKAVDFSDGTHEARNDEQVYLTPVLSSGEDSSRQLKFYDLVSFAFQVARGMEYLSLKKIIHRDLAARNVLVAENLVLKIADFGLTRNTEIRNYYQRASSGLLPVMWMAPESLADNRYTMKSDVWSFGVLLWEVFSFGDDPYVGVPHEELLDRLLQGLRMEKPTFCSDEVAEVMWRCWELNPLNRPDFSQLVTLFDRMVTSSTSAEYLALENITEDYADEVFQPEASPFMLKMERLDMMPFHQVTLHNQPQGSSDSQYASLSSHQSLSTLSDAGTIMPCHETGSLVESDQLSMDSVSTA